MAKSVLILDDDATFSGTLARSFTRKGCESYVASDISDARANLIEHQPWAFIEDHFSGNFSNVLS
tara:strand:- start:1327 stop:1521 length:195 start_codon:yes stop_codon:yes gene_type:complete